MLRERTNIKKTKFPETVFPSYKSDNFVSKKDYQNSNKSQINSQNIFVDNYDLPANYNTTSITLIARDPHWIYAYWEIAPHSIEDIKKKVGNEFSRCSYVLRVYDVTFINFNGSNANSWFDIDIGFHVNNWYINLWCDNVTYCVEIGLRTSDGRFFALTRSNYVTTPRVKLSGRSDLIWMEVKGNKINQYQEKLIKKNKSTHKSKKSRRKIFLNEDDVKTYYSKLFLPLKETNNQKKNNDDKSICLNRRYKLHIKEGGVPFESFFLKGLPHGEFVKKILLGSSEELILKGGASELKGGASEREDKKRKFFFEIGTELIVYGRTEPDAKVHFNNSEIKLREDGTFSLRFALPDGVIPLDFTAQSKDKVEKRSIKTSVEREKTKYSPQ